MIDILLATYNGEAFVRELLDSLLSQTDADWRLLVRDDGSTDGTLPILRLFAAAHPGRVEIVEDGRGNMGVIANFSTLMEMSDAEYVMFCDQDDVWLPDKIAKTRLAMERIESQRGSDWPLLVHCDLRVVDEDLRQIAPSFMRHQRFDPVLGSGLNRLLVQNIAPGCTMMINRALKRLAIPVPEEAMMHDWWAMLIAAALGEIAYLDEPLVLYRQHGVNAVGAKGFGPVHIACRLFTEPLRAMRRTRQILVRAQGQAASFLAVHGNRLTPSQLDMVSSLASIFGRNFLSRRAEALRMGLRPASTLRSLLYFACL